MTTTKTHLAQSVGNGKINLHKSVCGLSDFNKNGRFNYIARTATFKALYRDNGEEVVCLKCLEKAQAKNRI